MAPNYVVAKSNQYISDAAKIFATFSTTKTAIHKKLLGYSKELTIGCVTAFNCLF